MRGCLCLIPFTWAGFSKVNDASDLCHALR